MAAYVALTSLMHIIHDIEHHPFPPISINKHQVKSLKKFVSCLQEFLETYHLPIDEAYPMEMCIADVAYAVEDVIEFHIVDMIDLRRSTTTYHQQIYSGRETSSSGSSSQTRPTRRSNYFGCLLKPINHGRKINLTDNLYQGLQKVIKDMELVKKEVMKITVVEAQLQRSVSASAGSSRSSIMVGFDDVKLDIMDKLTAG